MRTNPRLILLPVAAAALLAAPAAWLWLRPAPEPPAAAAGRRVLRVCSDPNNLPFSNDRLEGFENRIAELLARELDAGLEYFWWAQRRGAMRNTLQAGRCDVVIGAPSSIDRALTTAPYYRSTYVFVTREDRPLAVASFDSPLLRKLRVGVHVIGDDGASTPPVHVLERRKIIRNLVGYRLTEDYGRPNPPARLLEGVVNGDVDIAVAWGPLAGYYARREKLPIRLTPAPAPPDLPFLPMAFDISAAVRRGEEDFRAELDGILRRQRAEIAGILDSYGIPRLDAEGRLIAGSAP